VIRPNSNSPLLGSALAMPFIVGLETILQSPVCSRVTWERERPQQRRRRGIFRTRTRKENSDPHLTPDKPTNDAQAAKSKYELPEQPTHSATVPEERVPNARVPEAGPTTSGGGSQLITDEPIPVYPGEIVPLEPMIAPEILIP